MIPPKVPIGARYVPVMPASPAVHFLTLFELGEF